MQFHLSAVLPLVQVTSANQEDSDFPTSWFVTLTTFSSNLSATVELGQPKKKGIEVVESLSLETRHSFHRDYYSDQATQCTEHYSDMKDGRLTATVGRGPSASCDTGLHVRH